MRGIRLIGLVWYLYCVIATQGWATSHFSINAPLCEDSLLWTSLPPLPTTLSDKKPIGVSAPFAGMVDEKLVVAGGCNFPNKPAAEGGKKQYYASVYQLESDGWIPIGNLKSTRAYGASVTTPYGLVCIGGCNQEGATNEVFLIASQQGQIVFKEFPPLPVALDNAAAVYIQGTIYVTGGYADGKPNRQLFALSLSAKKMSWQRLASFPSATRVQPVMAAVNDKLYLAGGFQPLTDSTEAILPTSVLAYEIATDTWRHETFLPPLQGGEGRTLAGACAVVIGEDILFLGGVNRQLFLEAIRRPLSLHEARQTSHQKQINALQRDSAQYLHHPVAWYRFNSELLVYTPRTKQWSSRGHHPPIARAGAAAVWQAPSLYIINGELKPGIRTPEVNELLVTQKTINRE